MFIQIYIFSWNVAEKEVANKTRLNDQILLLFEAGEAYSFVTTSIINQYFDNMWQVNLTQFNWILTHIIKRKQTWFIKKPSNSFRG